MENSRKRMIPFTKPQNVKAKKAASASPIVHEEIVEPDPAETQRIYTHLRGLPPGYRFKPSDIEIIRDYLMPKLANRPIPTCLIHSVNLYRFHPATLAERYLKHPDGAEVYYFTPRNRKYRNGSRPNRGVEGFGYWKAGGADVKIMDRGVHIGFKKTLSFHEGKYPTGTKTNWIMYEYKVVDPRERTSVTDMKLDDWVLCKLYYNEATRGKKINEEAETNIIDTEADNAHIVANTDYDEEDHGQNTGYSGTSNDEEDHRRYTGYCGSSNVEEDGRRYAGHWGMSYDREGNGRNIGSCSSTSNEEEGGRRYTGHLGMSYHREGNGRNIGSCSSSYEEEDGRRNTGPGNPYHNQFTDYDEAYRLLNAGQWSTYNNDLYQSHRDMVSHSLPSSLYPIPTGQANYNVFSGNYQSGNFSNELRCDLGPSYANELITHGRGYHLPSGMGVKGSDMYPVVDLSNFPGSSYLCFGSSFPRCE